MPRLVITNGDSTVGRLKAAGIPGRHLPWRDALHDGPVPRRRTLEELSDVRAEHLTQAFGLPFDEVRADFAARDGQLDVHPAYAEVELWFEHDLYDQLQLIQLLDYFAAAPERTGLALAQADRHLALLELEELKALAGRVESVTSLQLELGRAAWEAFTAPDPLALAALASAPLPALPHLASALRRGLAELPAPGSGLSLTQERALRVLTQGPAQVGRLFAAVLDQEAAAFMGDLSFFGVLDEMAFGPEPLISGLPGPARDLAGQAQTQGAEERGAYVAYAAAAIHLTPAGERVLAGKLDHAQVNGLDRWLGGTHVTPASLWRYDREESRIVPPH